MVELPSMDVTVLTRIGLALQLGIGSVIGPATMPASATARRGETSRRDLGRRPR